jgi:C4-dicarboxylate transporter, DctM subunit
MFDVNATAIVLGLLLLLVLAGVHVAVALGATAVVGVYLVLGSVPTTLDYLSSTSYEALRDYLFAVIPLFIVMGEFIGRSGAAADVFTVVQRKLSSIPGRLAHATVLGNVVFAFVTGTSVAAATAFTKIAYPQMRRFGYQPGFSLGLIAGSACIGMLIPPSVLLVVWGLLTEQSIGTLFLAGIVPGLLLALGLMLYVVAVTLARPGWVGHQRIVAADRPQPPLPQNYTPLLSTLGVLIVILGSLGGIWLGLFTATEGAGMGALLGLGLMVAKGKTAREVFDAILATGRSSIPIMVLLFAAQLYSRSLALSGVGSAIEELFLTSGLGPIGILMLMLAIWFVLGMLIDSISIMLLTVPVFAPLAAKIGFDPVAFALIGVLVIEAGLLTPPFGVNVFSVKSAASEFDRSARMSDIFAGAVPSWAILLVITALLVLWPSLATWLPKALS